MRWLSPVYKGIVKRTRKYLKSKHADTSSVGDQETITQLYKLNPRKHDKTFTSLRNFDRNWFVILLPAGVNRETAIHSKRI
jgi:hypothetical protein